MCKDAQKALNDTCPKCGHCPHCGRSNLAPNPYWYPYGPWPWYQYPTVTYGGGSQSGAGTTYINAASAAA